MHAVSYELYRSIASGTASLRIRSMVLGSCKPATSLHLVLLFACKMGEFHHVVVKSAEGMYLKAHPEKKDGLFYFGNPDKGKCITINGE